MPGVHRPKPNAGLPCARRPRFATLDAAQNHHRARLGGAAVEPCACGGYHHKRRKPQGAGE